jgi:hypothetical protein
MQDKGRAHAARFIRFAKRLPIAAERAEGLLLIGDSNSKRSKWLWPAILKVIGKGRAPVALGLRD